MYKHKIPSLPILYIHPASMVNDAEFSTKACFSLRDSGIFNFPNVIKGRSSLLHLVIISMLNKYA